MGVRQRGVDSKPLDIGHTHFAPGLTGPRSDGAGRGAGLAKESKLKEGAWVEGGDRGRR